MVNVGTLHREKEMKKKKKKNVAYPLFILFYVAEVTSIERVIQKLNHRRTIRVCEAPQRLCIRFNQNRTSLRTIQPMDFHLNFLSVRNIIRHRKRNEYLYPYVKCL